MAIWVIARRVTNRLEARDVDPVRSGEVISDLDLVVLVVPSLECVQVGLFKDDALDGEGARDIPTFKRD
jgi:hypothetical protein